MSLKITKEALQLLAMNNASCKVFGEKKTRNLRYLTLRAIECRDFDFAELVANLPEVGIMYKSLEILAKHSKRDVIDMDVMLEFLGGKWHLDYVMEQANFANLEKVFGKEFSQQFIFSHALIPVRLTKVVDGFEAIYENGQAKVQIKNFIQHPLVTQELGVGRVVLLHQALVVAIADESVARILLEKELSEERFMAVARELTNVDYEKFWDLKAWTIKTIENLGV